MADRRSEKPLVVITATEGPVCFVLKLFGGFPVLCLVLLYATYGMAAIQLGRWPAVSSDDPKYIDGGVSGFYHFLLVLLNPALVAIYFVIPVLAFAALIAAAIGARTRVVSASLFPLGAVLLFWIHNRLDPLHVVHWFLDCGPALGGRRERRRTS